MVTPLRKLNRLITISASSTETIEIPTYFYFEGFVGLTDSLTRDWAAGNIGGSNAFNDGYPNPPIAATEYLSVNQFRFPVSYVNGDSPFIGPLPDLTQLMAGQWLRLYHFSDNSLYVEYDVVSVSTGTGSGTPQYRVNVENGRIVGATQFEAYNLSDIDAANARFGFQSVTTSQSETTTTDRRAWAAITDRGSQTGFLIVEGADTTEAAQEEVEIETRYEPALTIGETITDDLGRTWIIDSTRSLLDRRRLLHEGHRFLQTEG